MVQNVTECHTDYDFLLHKNQPACLSVCDCQPKALNMSKHVTKQSIYPESAGGMELRYGERERERERQSLGE